jgi:hypothetical protein
MTFALSNILAFRTEARDTHMATLQAEVDAAFDDFLRAVGAQTRAGDAVTKAQKAYCDAQFRLDQLKERSRG